MRKTDRLDQILIAAQSARQRASDLGNFERMGEAGAKVITLVVDEDLSLVFKPSEGGGVENTVAVALKCGAIFRLVIQIGAALRVLAAHSIWSQAFIFILFKMLASEVHGSSFQRLRHCEDRSSSPER